MRIELLILAAAAIKITALVIGFFIARLGHDTLIKGIKGDFTVKGQAPSGKFQMVSSSPGLFFVLMGTALMIWALYSSRPLGIEWKIQENQKKESTTQTKDRTPTPEDILEALK